VKDEELGNQKMEELGNQKRQILNWKLLTMTFDPLLALQSLILDQPFSRSSPSMSCTFGFCSSRSRFSEPVSGNDFRISATINTHGSESTVAN